MFNENKCYNGKGNILNYEIIHKSLTKEEIFLIIDKYVPVLVPECFYAFKENYVNENGDTGVYFVNRFPIDNEEIVKENDYRLLFIKLSKYEYDFIKKLNKNKIENRFDFINDKKLLRIIYLLTRQKTIYWVREGNYALIKEYDQWLKTNKFSTNKAVEVMTRYNKYRFGITNLYTPGQASILTTNKCNAACIHCYRRNDLNSEDLLTTYELNRFLNQCSDISVTSINLLGGEPLLREDIEDIIKKCKEKNLKLKITTNGIRLANKEFVRKIAQNFDNSLMNVQISIDGIGDMQSKIRPGAEWDLMEKAFENLNENNIRWDVNTVVTRITYENIETFIKELNKLGIPSIRFSMLKQCGKGNIYDKLVLTPFELNEAKSKINYYAEKYNQAVINTIRSPLFMQQEEPEKLSENPYKSCNAMNYQFSLSYNLKYLPCEFYEPFADSWGESFYYVDIFDFWHNSVLAKKYRSIKVDGKCRNCNYNFYCSMGCPVESKTLTGNINEGDPLCWYDPKLKREMQLSFPNDYSYIKEAINE